MSTDVIDFGRSFVTFVTSDRANTARIQVECGCVVSIPGQSATEYLLVASCKSEDVYVADGLFKQPNYDFCAIFSNHEYAIVRTYASSQESGYEIGKTAERFGEVNIHVVRTRGRVCEDNDEIVSATLANVPLIGQTTLREESSGLQATLEYPVKTMNVWPEKKVYQVDTGPVIFPDLGALEREGIERFTLAYVAFNRKDRAEFVLQVPTPVDHASEARTPHYSEVRKVASSNRVVALR